MRLLDRIKAFILPEPPPAPFAAEAPRLKHPPALSPEEQEELQGLERGVYEESEKNRKAALQSVRVSHVAISAEERSRSTLDELMRSMDRGQKK